MCNKDVEDHFLYLWKLKPKTFHQIHFLFFFIINPIPAGVLENQDTLGRGSIWPPPPLNSMFDVQIWQMIHHWKALVLYFKNMQKKLLICKNWVFLQNPVIYSKNACKKKNCPKIDKLYIFEKPLTMPFQICKKFCKILNNLMFN